MKKWIVLFMCCVLFLIGCGNNDNKNENDTTNQTSETTQWDVSERKKYRVTPVLNRFQKGAFFSEIHL